jgi:hypothetical protein
MYLLRLNLVRDLDGIRNNDGKGANLVVPKGLIPFVPRIAHSLATLSKFHSQKSPMIDYYERVSSTEESIDNTKMLVLSGFYKAINSVK